jgi:MFS family permease
MRLLRIWGGSSSDAVTSLMTLGALLALYDGAEVLLKPVFGTISDRIGARPVLLLGLVGFAVASSTYVIADRPGWLWVARLGQGAAATAALSVGVGFLPVTGASDGLGTIATGAAVSLLAATAAIVQPRAGRALDAGKLTTRTGIAVGLGLAAVGLVCAALPGVVFLLIAAALIGAGTGVITPLGFAALAASTPQERLGQTMGTAELGRELGDAGGPLLVAAVASIAVLDAGYVVLAVLLAAGLLMLRRVQS